MFYLPYKFFLTELRDITGCNNHVRRWCSSLTCRHYRQRAKYSTTSFFMFGQKKSFMIMVIIFWYPGCLEYGYLWISFITVSLIYAMFGMYILFLCINNPCLFRLKYVFTWFCSFLAVFSFKIWYCWKIWVYSCHWCQKCSRMTKE